MPRSIRPACGARTGGWPLRFQPGTKWLYSFGMDVGARLVEVLSGLAFGADLALPASLLADVIDHDAGDGGHRPDGAYFGLWHLLEKLALALAAGIALPLLQWLNYVPGTAAAQGSALSWVYALLPCVIKLVALLLLWLSGPESRQPSPGWRGVQA